MTTTLAPPEPTNATTDADRLGRLLGLGHEIASDRDLMRLVAQRLEPSAVESLQAHGLTAKEIAALIIPIRTLSHRRARAERLTVEETDRAIRVARLLSLAATVFGSAERALAWLRTALPRFDGAAPMTLLATDVGARLVEELLIQIDEGYVG